MLFSSDFIGEVGKSVTPERSELAERDERIGVAIIEERREAEDEIGLIPAEFACRFDRTVFMKRSVALPLSPSLSLGAFLHPERQEFGLLMFSALQLRFTMYD